MLPSTPLNATFRSIPFEGRQAERSRGLGYSNIVEANLTFYGFYGRAIPGDIRREECFMKICL